jgi:hypothetical protein
MSKLGRQKSDLPSHEPRLPTLSPAKESNERKRRRVVEIFSEKDLTFPKFVRSDMSKFTAKVIGVQKKVLSFTV